MIRRGTDSGRIARTAGRALALALLLGGPSFAADTPAKDDAKVAKGRELFNREWLPGDARSHGGDGLGPVFNDSSCVACHNAGGAGGAGPSSKNVDILSAFANSAQQVFAVAPARAANGGFAEKAAEMLLGIDPPKVAPRAKAAQAKPRKPDTKPLIAAHAGFRTTRSVVLHKAGVDPGYADWRSTMLGTNQFAPAPIGLNTTDAQRGAARLEQVRMLAQFRGQNFGFQGQAGEFSLLRSQRNPTALFGSGLIDSIPEAALIEIAKRQEKESPTTAGRVAKQKDGRIGRFGWKAQTPSLNDFVLTACAVELGLEVPGHGQGGLPQKPEEKAKGLDMDAAECEELVAYVKALAKPVELNVQSDDVKAGRALFNKIGCATCHTPKLGEVDGIYSDLLIHDMGQDLGDTGQYGVFTPGSADPEFEDDPVPAQPQGGVSEAVPVDVLEDPVLPRPFPLGLVGRVLFGRSMPVVNQVLRTEMVSVPAVAPADIAATTPADIAAAPAASPAQAAPDLPPPPPILAPVVAGVPQAPAAKRPTGPAGRQEWRTPPLWGFRDSGPYLHDGRADTLEQAVALHGGQGQASATAYFALSAKERMQLEAFLKSLAAPTDLQ